MDSYSLNISMLLQSSVMKAVSEPIILWVMVGYFVVVIAIGIWATKRTKTASDFFIAGKSLGVMPLAMAAMASTVSGFSFIGGPGLIYTVGMGAVFIVLPAALTNSVNAWVMAKRLRLLAEVRPLLTIPDAIGARYSSRSAQGLSAVAIVIGVVGYLATNLLALGLVIESIFSIGLSAAVIIGTLLVLVYSVSGGILAGVWNDVFQGTLMSFASLAVFLYALSSVGGMSEMSTTILQQEPDLLSQWGRLTPLAALSFFFVFGIGTLGQPHVLHKFYMLKDPRQLKWFPVLMTITLTLSLLLFVGVGLAMKALVLQGQVAPLSKPDDATPLFLLNFTPAPLAALAFAGLAAAIMSSVNSFMSIGAAAITHDLPIAFGFKVRNELKWGRIWTVLLSAAAMLVAMKSHTAVIFLGIFGWGIFASTLVPALAIGLNWKGATKQGAVCSILAGLLTTLSLETMAWLGVFTFPSGVNASAISMTISILVFVAVSQLTRGSTSSSLPPDVRAVMEI